MTSYIRLKNYLKGRSGSWLYLLVIIALLSLMVLPGMGRHDLSEWDESRNGVNALEMLHNGDYIHLYYEGKPDTWNAKPPLLAWMIAGSYRIFGFNAFALRFPSFLGMLFFFIYFFRLVRLFASKEMALACCLLMLSCKAMLGWHIGLTGDFDALLVFALTASAYYFVKYVEHGKQYAVFMAALFSGLAFYVKGTAGFLFIPGLVAYVLLRGKGQAITGNYRTWLAALLYLLVVGSWICLVLWSAEQGGDSFYGSRNSLETLFLHDTVNRLSDNAFGFDKEAATDYFLLFHTLDARMQVWNYLFYLGVLAGIIMFFRKGIPLHGRQGEDQRGLMLLSCCLIVPPAIVLSLSKHAHDWYLAPVLPFIAIITVQWMFYFSRRWAPFRSIAAALFILAFSMQFYYLYTLPDDMHRVFNNRHSIFKGQQVVVTDLPRQDIMLYLAWMQKEVKVDYGIKDPGQYGGKLLLLRHDLPRGDRETRFEKLECFKDFCIMREK